MEESIMQFFAYEHLREDLKAVSKPFGDMAYHLVDSLPRNAERSVALRKLLEAKDAAVRSALDRTHQAPAPGQAFDPANSGRIIADREHDDAA
jgi:hypothetical protein